jgi:hypothetical protein
MLDVRAVRDDRAALRAHARADGPPCGLRNGDPDVDAIPHGTQERRNRCVELAGHRLVLDVGVERRDDRRWRIEHAKHRRTWRERLVHVHDVRRELLECVADDAGGCGVDAEWNDRPVKANAERSADDAHVRFGRSGIAGREHEDLVAAANQAR